MEKHVKFNVFLLILIIYELNIMVFQYMPKRDQVNLNESCSTTSKLKKMYSSKYFDHTD